MFTRKPTRDKAPTAPTTPAAPKDSQPARPMAMPAQPVQPVQPLQPAFTPPAQSKTSAPAMYKKGSGTMIPSVIGVDLTVTGNVMSKGEVQVEGEVQGDIQCSSLIVGESAVIRGNVVAEDIVIRGTVRDGSVRGVRVTLQHTAKVEADVFHQSLAIEQGAYFEGKSRRSDDPLNLPKKDTVAVPQLTSAVDGTVTGFASGAVKY